ncbi:MAG: hypothetical protein AB7P40_26950 [Chloroflexota bacterium]
MVWRSLLAVFAIAAASLFGLGAARAAVAADRTTFQGCVTERTEMGIVLRTSADELVAINTTWIDPNMLDSVLVDCVTVTALTVDGHYVAESIEAGDEPNEINSVTRETTADREQRNQEREDRKDRDDRGDKKHD